MKKIAILLALGWSTAMLAACSTAGVGPQVPSAVTAPSVSQSQATLPTQGSYITKKQAVKIARRALDHWCRCYNWRYQNAKLVQGKPPYWNVHFDMMMCDAWVWVKADNGNVLKIRHRC